MKDKYLWLFAALFSTAVVAQETIDDDAQPFTTPVPLTTLEIDANYQALCDKKTGLMEVAEPLQACLNTTINPLEILVDVAAGYFNKRVIEKYCSRKPALFKCMNNYVAEIQACLAPVVLESWKMQEDIIEMMLDAVCFDNGSHLYEFISKGGLWCMQSQLVNITKCGHSIVESYFNQIPVIQIQKLNEISGIDDKYNEKVCSELKEYHSCMVEALNGCSNQTPAAITNTIMNKFLGSTPCEKIIKK